jgi:hypothetical protein
VCLGGPLGGGYRASGLVVGAWCRGLDRDAPAGRRAAVGSRARREFAPFWRLKVRVSLDYFLTYISLSISYGNQQIGAICQASGAVTGSTSVGCPTASSAPACHRPRRASTGSGRRWMQQPMPKPETGRSGALLRIRTRCGFHRSVHSSCTIGHRPNCMQSGEVRFRVVGFAHTRKSMLIFLGHYRVGGR